MVEIRADLVFSLRLFARHKRLAFTAIASLALALGANTTIFSLIDAIVMRQLPVPHPERLVALRYSTPQSDTLLSFSLPMFERLAALPVFEGVMARSNSSQNVAIGGITHRALVEIVSENYFTLLGANAQLGRTFLPSNEEQPVAVLSYGYWRRRFSGATSAIGARISINDYPFTIIGVMPPEFDGTDPGVPPDLRVPLRLHPRIMPWNAFGRPNQRSFELFARLQDGFTLRQAESAARTAYQLDQNIQERNPPETLHVDQGAAGRSRLRNRYREPLFALQSLLLVCLLLACANVANLLVALAQSRSREIAVRLAVGASRSRLIRQLITEGLLLSSIACALGVLLARWSVNLLIAEIPAGLNPLSLNFSIAMRNSGFALALATLAGIGFGCIPAIQSTRAEIIPALRGASPARGMVSRGTSLLGAVQVGLSLVLLTAAALFLHSLQTIESIEPGFRLDHMIVANVAPSNQWSAAATDRFYREAEARLVTLPGVRGAAFINNGLLTGTTWTTQIEPAGTFAMDAVTPGFFTVTNTRIVSGREFQQRDGSGAPPVVVLNQSAAHSLFQGSQPLGRRIKVNGREHEVVGIIGDTRAADLHESPTRQVYFCAAQRRMNSAMSLHVWTLEDPDKTIAAIRDTLRAVDPSVPLYGEKTMQRRRDVSLSSERLLATLSTSTATLALLLAALGLFAVLAQAVTQRTREFGIRRAVGAPARHLVRLVAAQAFWIVGLGLLAGVPLALAATRLARGLLFGLSTWDPAMLGIALVVVLAAATIAAAIPAIRATQVDPAISLRHE
jgi:predicted permease